MDFDEEVAEFVGGHMDGRTMTVRTPGPHIIEVPVPVNLLATVLTEGESPLDAPSFYTASYRKSGRNDAGRLRYVLESLLRR